MQYSKMTLFLAFAIMPNPQSEGVLLSTKNTASSTSTQCAVLFCKRYFVQVYSAQTAAAFSILGQVVPLDPFFPTFYSLKLR